MARKVSEPRTGDRDAPNGSESRQTCDMDEPGTQVDAATMERWAGFALHIRTYSGVLAEVTVPSEGTPFARADNLYPSESISQWCREGLRSALEHLGVWADHAVPLQQFEGQVVQHSGFRWSFTLMRAALEGAAQSLWLSSSSNSHEAMARLVRMVRHDLGEQATAWTAIGRDTATVLARLARHEDAAAQLVEHGKDTPRLPAMVDLVKSGASGCGLDAGLYEGHWRVCSAAAHGKDWAIQELQTFTGQGEEWRPGQFHLNGHVDPAKLTEVLSDTLDLTMGATRRYLDRAFTGDQTALVRRMMLTAARATPQKDGGAMIERMAKEWGL